MNPAFSVIFFTTASGAGYGIWMWVGLLAACNALPSRMLTLVALGVGFVLVSAGLLSSLLHLGKPTRAWRAFSQWRSSWLSREGVASVLCFLPALWMAGAVWVGWDARIVGVLLIVLSFLTVVCTSMIYASLKPIPAWRHPAVVPVYLLFALFTGGLLLTALLSLGGATPSSLAGFGALVLAAVLWRTKHVYWRAIAESTPLPSRNSALGVPMERKINVFERPSTEDNYLTREMGFVLARKHAERLRIVALVLFALMPALCALPIWAIPHMRAEILFIVASVSALAGAMVERWLFFAEAKHTVRHYH